MVRIRDVAWALAAAAVLAGSRPASADPITLTGNVANDFTAANGSVENPIALRIARASWYSSTGQLTYTSGPGWVAGATAAAQPVGQRRRHPEHLVQLQRRPPTRCTSGSRASRTSPVSRRSSATISGNPNPALDANSNPSRPDLGATNTWLGDKSIALAFAPITTNAAGQTTTGTPSIIAGIPRDQVERHRHARLSRRAVHRQRLGAAVQLRAARSPTRGTWPSTPRRRPRTSNSRSTTSARSPASTRPTGSTSRDSTAWPGAPHGKSRLRVDPGSPGARRTSTRPSPRPGWPGCCWRAAGWRYRRRLAARP